MIKKQKQKSASIDENTEMTEIIESSHKDFKPVIKKMHERATINMLETKASI